MLLSVMIISRYCTLFKLVFFIVPAVYISSYVLI